MINFHSSSKNSKYRNGLFKSNESSIFSDYDKGLILDDSKQGKLIWQHHLNRKLPDIKGVD